MQNNKQLENRDLKIYENEIKESKDFRQLNRWREELELANKILKIKVKGNEWEIKERTFFKTNSRLLLAISHRRGELIASLPWYSLLKPLVWLNLK